MLSGVLILELSWVFPDICTSDRYWWPNTFAFEENYTAHVFSAIGSSQAPLHQVSVLYLGLDLTSLSSDIISFSLFLRLTMPFIVISVLIQWLSRLEPHLCNNSQSSAKACFFHHIKIQLWLPLPYNISSHMLSTKACKNSGWRRRRFFRLKGNDTVLSLLQYFSETWKPHQKPQWRFSRPTERIPQALREDDARVLIPKITFTDKSLFWNTIRLQKSMKQSSNIDPGVTGEQLEEYYREIVCKWGEISDWAFIFYGSSLHLQVLTVIFISPFPYR